jgi:hypothetical protein
LHSYTTGIIGVVAAGAAVFALAGCGGSDNKNSQPTATAGPSGLNVEIGNTINYASVGTTADIDCANGKSLTVGGTNNTLTVKGTCASVNIGGSDNKITFEKIDQDLAVLGFNNNVTYKAGDPKVTNTGSNNTVTKG